MKCLYRLALALRTVIDVKVYDALVISGAQSLPGMIWQFVLWDWSIADNSVSFTNEFCNGGPTRGSIFLGPHWHFNACIY